MKRLISLLLGVTLAGFATAAVLTVSWTNATQNVDGTAIPATGAGSIASTRVEYGTCNGTAFGTKLGEFTVAGAATSGPTPNFAPGTYCGRAFHTNTYGEESGPSNVAQKTIAAPVPKPPTGFSLG